MNDILELIQEQYKKDNFRIEYNDCKNGLAYIYCSSNALYKQDDPQSFTERVIIGDRYEWMNLRADSKPELEIFIRDIWLSWYVKGINERINSYEKLIDFMKYITCGYTVRCVGASSGGFIGTILAMDLSAEISYSFAGQFSLVNHFDHLQSNPYLHEYSKRNDDKYIEYYKRLPDAEGEVLYLFPIQSEQDQQQYNLLKDIKNVHTIKVQSSEHGVAIYPFAVQKLLSYNAIDAEKLGGGGYFFQTDYIN